MLEINESKSLFEPGMNGSIINGIKKYIEGWKKSNLSENIYCKVIIEKKKIIVKMHENQFA